jgi:hypothetical protein
MHWFRVKWHALDEDASAAVAGAAGSGGIHGLHPSLLDSRLKRVTNVCSYFFQSYPQAQTLPDGKSVVGEALVARADAGLLKHYVYAIARTESGGFEFAGPYLPTSGHHLPVAHGWPVSSLFLSHFPIKVH